MFEVRVFKSSFSSEYEKFEFEKEGKVKDLFPKIDFTNNIVYVNGFQKDENYLLKENDFCIIQAYPGSEWNELDWGAVIGGAVFGLVMGALVGLATGGFGAFAWGWLWTGLGFSGAWAIGSGVTALVNDGMTIGSWLESITEEESPDTQKQLPNVNGAKNQKALNKTIPFVMGRHLMAGYYIGTPYRSVAGDDGKDQYMQMALLLGYNKLKVSDIKLGNTRLATNTDNILNGFIPLDSDSIYQDKESYDMSLELRQDGTSLDLYPSKVYDEQVQIELLRTQKEGEDPLSNKPIRFSAKNPQKIEIELTIPTLIAYDDKGKKQNASVEIKAEYRWSTLEDDNQAWRPFPSFSGVTEYNPSTGVNKFTRQKSETMRFVATKEFAFSDIPLDANNNIIPSTYIEVRLERMTNLPTDSKETSKVYFSGLRTWCFDYTKTKEKKTIIPQSLLSDELKDKVAVLGFKCKASDLLSGQLDELNCVLQSYARTWNKEDRKWSVEESPTSNPASIMLKALQSEMLGEKKYDDSKINLVELGELYEFCEDIHRNDLPEDETLNTRGCKLECNGVLTQKKKLQDLLVEILWTARSTWTIKDNQITVITDKAKSNYITILNNQNVLSATNSKNFDEIPDGYKVDFIDEYDNWQQNTMYINFDDGSTVQKEGYKYEPTEARYQTGRRQVWQNHLFEGCKKFLRPEIWTRKVSLEGYLIFPGDLVLVQDDTIVVGIGDGGEITGIVTDEQTDGDYITHIITDGKFNVSDLDKRYGLQVIQADGANEPKIRTVEVEITEAGYHSEFKLKEPIYKDELVIPTVGDIVSFGEYDKISTVAICLGKKSSDDNTFELTLAPYDKQSYEYEKNVADKGIPVFDSKINPPQKLAGVQEVEPELITRDELYKQVENIVSGSNAAKPITPMITLCKAERDGIRLSCTSDGSSMSETLTSVTWEYSKDNGNNWKELEDDSPTTMYSFDRNLDGYIERDELTQWCFRVKSFNIYGIESNWSNEVSVNVQSYATWEPSEVNITTCNAHRDGIDLAWVPQENKSVYGSVLYRVYKDNSLITETTSSKYTYTFNREVDGYPEKEDLNYTFYVRAFNTESKKYQDSEQRDITTSQYKTWIPNKVTISSCTATRDGIDLAWTAGDSNVYGTTVYRVYKEGKFITETGSLNYTYIFNRDTDGYPEKEDLNYAFFVESYNQESKKTSSRAEKEISTVDYSTWKAPAVDIQSFIADKDGLVLAWSANPDLTYGSIKYKYEIKYDNNTVAEKDSILTTTDTYIFNRNTDGYPEKPENIQALVTDGQNPGRDISKYSVTVTCYTDQKPNDPTTDQESSPDIRSYGTWIPAAVRIDELKLDKDKISIKASQSSTTYGSLNRYIYKIAKKEGTPYEVITNSPVENYFFDREIDGYPEAEDLQDWAISVKAVSEAGYKSLTEAKRFLDTYNYGTWKLGPPSVYTRVSDRTISMVFSQPPRADGKEIYGNIKNRVQVKKPGKDFDWVWFKPASNLNPYPEEIIVEGVQTTRSNEDNYKDTSVEEGKDNFISVADTYIQTMPLEGQGSGAIIDTLYQFRIIAVNEAGESEAAVVNATATATNIRDIVKANETTKKAYISELTALSANLGSISQGRLSNKEDNNYWDLSDNIDDKGIEHIEGSFRVGGDDQYIQVDPIVVDKVTGKKTYEVSVRVGSFNLTTAGTSANGDFYVMKDDSTLDRTRITPTGTYFEHRDTETSEWYIISQMRADGILSQSVYSPMSLNLSNVSVEERRKRHADIGIPYLSNNSKVYHFDTSLLDQHGEKDIIVTSVGDVNLVDQYNASVSIDFTPAILAIAPYSEIGRSLYGQFKLEYSLGITNKYTIDFWIQYIWAENQVLFDIGNSSDKIRLVIQNDEVYYNTPDSNEVPYNNEQQLRGDVYVYNTPYADSSFIEHYNTSQSDKKTLEDLKVEFKRNEWLHIGVVLDANAIKVYLKDKEVSFTRYNTLSEECNVLINELQNTFLLDELLIDSTVTESFQNFKKNSIERVPWGALDKNQKHFILETENLVTNIFDTDLFKEKVRQVIQEVTEN